ncbi:hypothetical protein DF147_09360 [Burkholderia cenocepacia]|nr:hypothetical protein DF147_09360 [Burkholderia cenocepacia]RQV90698.1 hypothetical protein DF019_06225 [Burkholderia cenocepacia]
MPRIPLGEPASAVAQPAPTVQADPAAFGAATARAQEDLGNAGTQIAANVFQQKQKLDDDLARTSNVTALQTHSLNTEATKKSLDVQLQSGQIDQIGYIAALKDAMQQSYDQTIGALPDSHYKRVATIQAQGLNKSVSLSMQDALANNTRQLIGANAETFLDTSGKRNALEPANIERTLSTVDDIYPQMAASAGIPIPVAQKRLQDWKDAQWTDHAQNAAIMARSNGDLPALTKLEKDLTSPDGYYAGKLDANKRNQVLSTVVSNRLSLENQLESEKRAQYNEAVTTFNQGQKLVDDGSKFSPEFTQDLLAKTRGTDLEARAQTLVKLAAEGAGFSTMSLAQMRATVHADQSRAKTYGTDPDTEAVVRQREKTLTAAEDGYKTAPWETALKLGGIDHIPPIDTSGLTQLASSLAARAQLAPVVEDKAGRRVSLLTPDEARSVLQTVDALPTNTKAQALALLGRSMGNAARINDLAEQWKDKSPAAALAMKAGAADPSGGPLMMQSGMPVAQYILDGQDALSNKLVKVDPAAATGMQATIAKQIGEDVLPTQQLDDARRTAYFAAVASARTNGRDMPNSTDILTGVNVATGGLSKTGGVDPRGDRYMAAKPWGWSDDDFDRGVKQASISNIENRPSGRPVDSVLANGMKIPVDQFMEKFASYRLQRVGIGGTYTVLTGARAVTDATGAPLLIHLTKPVPKR